VFVEVKAREKLDDAAWSVTERQRLRIIAAAEAWLARYTDDRIRDIRFDAMLVAPGRIPRPLGVRRQQLTRSGYSLRYRNMPPPGHR
jgi:Holliday junction resolvase-like predicted endonuclease